MQARNIENFKQLSSEAQQSLAADINNFGDLIQHFPLGRRAWNLEIGIACYESALMFYTREQFPQEWAGTQNNLGLAYSNRIQGEKTQNIELAIAGYESALKVYTREQFPQYWAMTQNNLGVAYNDRIQGEKAQNIERAIACLESALIVYTCEQFPQYWAMTQNNLASAYSKRIQGERAQNIERAIACCQSALIVYTREKFPQYWATTQNNLGLAYSERIKGEKAQNIEQALACYESALIVRTRKQFPQDWAMTQNNLGAAYSERIYGEKTQNIERALACYESVLRVYTDEQFPQEWAGTQNNLGLAYSNRIQGEKVQNIERALACYESALRVYTREQFPQYWAMSQNNLGLAYSNMIQGEKIQNIKRALACYESALIVYTPTAFPLECLNSSRGLGNTAFTAGLWEIAIEAYEQAMTAVEYSRSWATSDDIRQQILAESIDVYEKAIQACVNSNQLEKAIEYCDRTRAQRLVDLMHSNDLYASSEIPPAVQKYLQEFEAKQRQIDAEVEQLRKPSESNKELADVGSQSRSRADLCAYTEKIQGLEGEKQQIWENIRSLDPVLAGQVQVAPMQFAAMQKLIDNSQTAILCFYTTTDDTHVFVIYKDKAPQIHTCQGEGTGSFQKWIGESWLLPYLQERKIWQQGMGEFLSHLSQRLKFDELIGNCLDGIEELIVIPHLFLHQIPLAALPINGNAFLGDKLLLRYVPSCRILEYCSERPTIESLKYGIVENATDDLYFTPFECEQIAEIVTKPERLKGSQEATVAAYRNLAQKVNIMHSSHHAVSRLDNPLESRLFLGDGSITLGELMTPGWRLPQLSDVFMSCCETNLGGTEITDNLLSLGTGFLCAGARSVVSTLWAVDDFATSLFSIFYYQYRREGLSRPEALWQAQVRLRTISGAELKELYQPQIDPLVQRIIGDLKSKLAVIQKEKQKLKLRHKCYHKETDEFKELGAELKKITKRENQIQKQKKGYESLKENIYTLSNPFDDLSYWSGFICQGLH
ncbi:CHAT domain-containing tetratricopeptide repeat protein [Microcoleus sp. S13_B4]|uniref:CHAT domain-containing tetratricopeptide repeat protein n=1 Tax=Microcoleus sp. S13_B4 TaxID=3055408 RepID=UPI002FD5DA82